MRHADVQDFYSEGGMLQIRVASMGNHKYESLAAINALIEKVLTREAGVSEQTIDAWRLTHEGVADDPGGLMQSPYVDQHSTAEAVTRVIAIKSGIDWDKYLAARRAIIRKEMPPAD